MTVNARGPMLRHARGGPSSDRGKKNSGSMVATSSVSAHLVDRAMATYCAPRLRSIGDQSCRCEWAPFWHSVNAVGPGVLENPMLRRLRQMHSVGLRLYRDVPHGSLGLSTTSPVCHTGPARAAMGHRSSSRLRRRAGAPQPYSMLSARASDWASGVLILERFRPGQTRSLAISAQPDTSRPCHRTVLIAPKVSSP